MNGGRYLIAVLLGVALVGLFIESRVDTGLSRDPIPLLLRLQRDEGELRRLTERAYGGQLRNFDPINRLRVVINNGYAELQTLMADAGQDAGLARQSRRLSEVFGEAAQPLEQLKRVLAFRRLIDLYLPLAGRELRTSLQAATVTQLPLGEAPRALLEEVTLLHMGLGNAVYALENKASLREGIIALQERFAGKEGEIANKVMAFVQYGAAMLDSVGTAQRLLAQQHNDERIASLNALYASYLAYQQNFKQRAQWARIGLFFLASAILLFLTRVFFNLQNTTAELKSTLTDLDFRKFAVDQHAIVSTTDVNGIITYANDRFCEVSGYTQSELIGKPHNVVKSGHHDAAFYKTMWQTIARGKVWHGIVRNRAKGGIEYWVDTTIVPHIGDDGLPFEYIAIRTDITEKVKAERQVAWLARIPEENPAPVMRLGHDASVLYANTAARKLFDDSIKHLWQQWVARALENQQPEEQAVTVGEREFQVHLVPVSGESYLNVYAHDVTERRLAERQLSHQARHDSLTGLANRHSFEEQLDAAIDAARMSGRSNVLLYLDLDQFKLVNDTCGHVAGDELLRQLAELLKEQVRSHDVLARLGGDEFAVLLRDCHRDKGNEIAEKLRNAIAQYQFIWSNQSFRVGVSIGGAAIDRNSDSRDQILAAADVACYAAKDAGRNRVHFYSLDDEEAAKRQDEMQWAGRIPQALAENRFMLMLQEIVPLQGDEAEQGHFEVLVRMLDEQGGVIPPGAFIPAAERYDLMPAIDHWVIRHIFDVLEELQSQGVDLEHWRFAINLSGQSIGDRELTEYVGQRIAKMALPAGLISFEVTETAAVSNLTEAVQFIKAFKNFGCKFALDDFGSGLSSFAYLKNLPVDYLKIDGAFVKDILDDPIDAAMVRSINEIGHEMQIKTIAEFVETDAIRQRLTEIGVDFGQGYGIGKPRPLGDVVTAAMAGATSVVNGG